MNTHQITLGGGKQQPVTFECTNGIEVMERLLADFKKAGGRSISNDKYGFAGSLNGHNVAYTMIDI